MLRWCSSFEWSNQCKQRNCHFENLKSISWDFNRRDEVQILCACCSRNANSRSTFYTQELHHILTLNHNTLVINKSPPALNVTGFNTLLIIIRTCTPTFLIFLECQSDEYTAQATFNDYKEPTLQIKSTFCNLQTSSITAADRKQYIPISTIMEPMTVKNFAIWKGSSNFSDTRNSSKHEPQVATRYCEKNSPEKTSPIFFAKLKIFKLPKNGF